MKRPRRAEGRKGKAAAPPAVAPDPAEHARTERAKDAATLLWMAWPGAAFLILAAAANRKDFDPTATRYGLNWPGDVPHTLSLAAVDTVVLVLLLRPWSFRDSIGRLVLALALFAPWTMLTFVTGVHGGPVMSARLSWQLMVCAGLFYGLVKVVAARKKPTASPERSST